MSHGVTEPTKIHQKPLCMWLEMHFFLGHEPTTVVSSSEGSLRLRGVPLLTKLENHHED